MNPIGIVRLTIQSAHIVPWNRLRGGPPDPFVSIGINGEAETAKTKYQSREFEPSWMETKHIIVYSLDDTLDLRLYDHHEHRRHVILGIAHCSVGDLREDTAHGAHHLPLIRDGKERGQLLADLAYYPASAPKDGLEYSSGIVSLYITGARRLDVGSSAPASLVAKVSLGYDGVPAYTTDPVSATNNPSWEAKYDFYCLDKEVCIIVVKIMGDGVEDSGAIVGELSMRLDDLLDGGVEWWPLGGCRSGDLRMKAEIKAV